MCKNHGIKWLLCNLVTAKEIVINVDRIIPASDPWCLLNELRPPRKSFDAQILCRGLEVLLKEQKEPSPSLQEVANQLGISISTIRHHCPELCCKIVARHMEYIQSRKRRRAEEIASEIKQVPYRFIARGHIHLMIELPPAWLGWDVLEMLKPEKYGIRYCVNSAFNNKRVGGENNRR